MGSPALNPEQKYTYKDYLGWPDYERWEIIEGVAYNISPAPVLAHQHILGKLYAIFDNFLGTNRALCFSRLSTCIFLISGIRTKRSRL